MSENYEPRHSTETEDPMVGDAPPRAHTLFSNKVYDHLKFVALVLLPALGTLYFTVAAITGLPFGEAVVGIIVAVDTFLGVLLGISTQQYKNDEDRYDGEVHVVKDDSTGEPAILFRADSTSIVDKDVLTFRVHK